MPNGRAAQLLRDVGSTIHLKHTVVDGVFYMDQDFV
jgi:hypothetical protein